MWNGITSNSIVEKRGHCWPLFLKKVLACAIEIHPIYVENSGLLPLAEAGLSLVDSQFDRHRSGKVVIGSGNVRQHFLSQSYHFFEKEASADVAELNP